MTAQPETTEPNRQDQLFAIYDRLSRHGHCAPDVVLVPPTADGGPDYAKADPANIEALPDDEWPADAKIAERAVVLIDLVAGCHEDSSFILHLQEDGPQIVQIHGPETDCVVAEAIIARDVEFRPVPRPLGKLAASFRALMAEGAAAPLTNAQAAGLREIAERFESRPVAANDNKPASPVAPGLDFINPTVWYGKPIPARQWYAADLVPMRQVTIINGDGGVGKSLLALQIAAAGAMGVDTLGMEPSSGRTIYVGAEDEAEEFHRRLCDIAAASDKGLNALGDFRLLSLADSDALISVPDKAGNMKPTPLFAKIVDFACTFSPRLIVFDTAADLFGGEEIKRSQVRQFIAELRKLAIGLDCAVILLAHPSVQGMQSGTGSSGSTAWNNSVRSRLYLTKGEKDADPDMRILKTMKANYGTTGGEIKLRWKDGAFVLDDGKPSAGAALVNAKAERVFRDVLSALNRDGERVAKTKGLNYAPKVMAERPDASGMSAKILEGAMLRLMAAGELRVVMEGPPSKPRQRLILTSEDYGLQA